MPLILSHESVVTMPELLSPAGDFPSLMAALKAGADAVYLGLEGCNMRARAGNFTVHEIEEAVERAHGYGARLYVCTNTSLRDEDVERLELILPELHSAGVDAVIASDLAAVDLAADNGLDVHVSVQANISNTRSLHVLKDMGVSRVILSRELSLNEISGIASSSPIEVEVFVHGALCTALSGRCYLSSYLYGRSANCGECLQPCRKKWRLVSEDGEFELETDASGYIRTYLLSPRDLCMIEHIPELLDAGVSALKIEGRGRPADYVGTVTGVYREAVDRYLEGEWRFEERWLRELKKVFNRGLGKGFYFSEPEAGSPGNVSDYVKLDVGEVVNYYRKAGAAEVRLWRPLKLGDEIIIQGRTTGALIQRVESIQVDGCSVERVEDGHAGILVSGRVREGDLVYRRVPRDRG
ncbi:putative protease MJ0090 [Methanothermobacter wolfeii]|nr:putative protease MJ0090 [Methanothermobacter wolfeii]